VTGYGNHTVIDGISVESRERYHVYLRPNGSGKSTLLKSLAGTVPVSERLDFAPRHRRDD